MNERFSPRRMLLPVVIAAFAALLGMCCYFRFFKHAANNQYLIRQEVLYPERGLITDRNGKLLAINETRYDLMVIPARVRSMDTARFCRLLGITRRQLRKRLRKAAAYSYHSASAFLKSIPEKQMMTIIGQLADFPGFVERVRAVRRYPDSVAAHVLGFANMISPQALKGARGYSRPGEAAGRSGLELAYDSLLRGKRGVRYYQVDSFGRSRGSWEECAHDTLATPGRRLVTGIDLDLQKLAETLMKNKVGSVVALDPATGEVLAYLSFPAYDPNLLSGPETRDNLQKLRKDPLHPMLNRPVQSRNAPGSSLKPVMALVALQQGLITPDDVFFCPQYFMAGAHKVNCEHFDGYTRLRKGIAQSCNTYFCNVFQKQMTANDAGTRASYDDWRAQLSLFGLGNKLGLDLPNEKGGLLPESAFYDHVNGRDNWGPNDIISLAIGQGEMEVTPLQLANMQSIIANRGYYFTPHLVRMTGDQKPGHAQRIEKHLVPIDAAHFETVIDGMQDAVETGTAAGIRIPGVILCGKTGTVENTKGKSHSIFAGFAPRQNPKIVIAVVVENAGYGASYAAPMASYLVEQYLSGKVTKPKEQVDWMISQNLLPGVYSPVTVSPVHK
ncbi:penicillin-binding transpeptidase domain-containing protein [Hufsiella ginkgonis]|uniref:Penicillin-binding protein 2 n=1 Tax=Hufsiella ginkgonis TaxID=2695274 RepID=A0A7K1XTI3_9SPHI|nr:penicillin-binding transpeptidase domain-containing protein [Hufsiella ginkgonis]MXV14272.1 penicillin-binding protein 2 [Hufsiella ginkgonis]